MLVLGCLQLFGTSAKRRCAIVPKLYIVSLLFMKAKNCDILCTTKERGKIMDINEMKKCNMMELQQIHRLKEEGKSIISY